MGLYHTENVKNLYSISCYPPFKAIIPPFFVAAASDNEFIEIIRLIEDKAKYLAISCSNIITVKMSYERRV